MPEISTQELSRPLREQFERGMAAYHKDNLDYAVTLFTDVLQKEPRLYECREALRAAQHRRGKSGGLFRKLLGSANPALAKAQLSLRVDPLEAMNTAEQVLNEDPRSAAAHDLLAKAAMAAGLPRTAVLSLEILFKSTPGDRDVALKLAAALVAAGQTERADRIYADLLKANPGDLEVARAYKDLGARRTLSDKGYASLASGQGNYRDALRDKAQAEALEQENRHVRAEDATERLLSDLGARAAADPGNLKVLRQMASLYAEQKQFERALKVYDDILKAEGAGDPSLAKAVSDTRLRWLEHRIQTLDPTLDDYAARRQALEKERDDFRLQDARARVERYPTDLAIRFELGQLYLAAGRVTEAIQELHRAQALPLHRLPALGMLAKAFSRRGMDDLAVRTLQNALKEKVVFDDEKKDLIYELGVVLERLGRGAEAVDHFKQIYEVDIGYRDVAARVDAYYASRSSGN